MSLSLSLRDTFSRTYHVVNGQFALLRRLEDHRLNLQEGCFENWHGLETDLATATEHKYAGDPEVLQSVRNVLQAASAVSQDQICRVVTGVISDCENNRLSDEQLSFATNIGNYLTKLNGPHLYNVAAEALDASQEKYELEKVLWTAGFVAEYAYDDLDLRNRAARLVLEAAERLADQGNILHYDHAMDWVDRILLVGEIGCDVTAKAQELHVKLIRDYDAAWPPIYPDDGPPPQAAV